MDEDSEESSDTLGSRTSLPVLTDLQVSNYNYFDKYRKGNVNSKSGNANARDILRRKFWRTKYAALPSELPSAAEAIEELFRKQDKVEYGRPKPPFLDVKNEAERQFLQQRISLPEGPENVCPHVFCSHIYIHIYISLCWCLLDPSISSNLFILIGVTTSGKQFGSWEKAAEEDVDCGSTKAPIPITHPDRSSSSKLISRPTRIQISSHICMKSFTTSTSSI